MNCGSHSGSGLSDRVYEGADIIDSRDVIARIEELKTKRDYPKDWSWSEDEEEELNKLIAFAAEAEGIRANGEALIADHYFKDYARNLAKDIGAIGDYEKWPLNCIDWEKDYEKWPANCIDWEKATHTLQTKFTCATYGDTKYWIR